MHAAQLEIPVEIFILPCEFLFLFACTNMGMYSCAFYIVGN
jgi:hypothetical protein